MGFSKGTLTSVFSSIATFGCTFSGVFDSIGSGSGIVTGTSGKRVLSNDFRSVMTEIFESTLGSLIFGSVSDKLRLKVFFIGPAGDVFSFDSGT